MLASEDESDALAARRFSLASDIVELVVLTTDDGFLQTLREGVGASRRLWHVLSADKISDLLMVGGVGILVLDVQALKHAAARFVADIKRQFPDLVLVAAGNRESETELARLISDGSIYRFIHKPMSPARAALFADAAVKRFQNQGRQTVAVAAAPTAGARRRPRRILIGVTGAAVAVLLAAGWLVQRQNVEHADVTADTMSVRPAESARRAASSAAPPGSQTLPPVRSVLMEAQERLLARAQTALDQHRLDEAASTIEAARKTGIATERVAQLATELARAREQTKAAAPRATSAPPSSPAAAGTAASPAVNIPSDPAPAAGPNATSATVLAPRAVTAPAADAIAASAPATELPADPVPARGVPAAAVPAAVPAPDVSAPALPAATLPAAPVPAVTLHGAAVTTPTADAITANAPEVAPAPDATAAAAPQPDAVREYPDAGLARRAFTTDVISANQLTLVKSVQPKYPPKAEENGVEGWVDLDFTVTDTGAVQNVAVDAAEPSGVFEAAATAGLLQWHFKPLVRDAKAVATRARIRIRFTLKH